MRKILICEFTQQGGLIRNLRVAAVFLDEFPKYIIDAIPPWALFRTSFSLSLLRGGSFPSPLIIPLRKEKIKNLHHEGNEDTQSRTEKLSFGILFDLCGKKFFR